MKMYFVVFKSYQKPGQECYNVMAENKCDAKSKFLAQNIKHDYIVKVIT